MYTKEGTIFLIELLPCETNIIVVLPAIHTAYLPNKYMIAKHCLFNYYLPKIAKQKAQFEHLLVFTLIDPSQSYNESIWLTSGKKSFIK